MPRQKPTVRKQDGQWTLTKPGYGFAPAETTVHDTHLDAVTQVLEQGVVSGGCHVLALNTTWDFDRAVRHR